MANLLSSLSSFLQNKESIHAQFFKYLICGGLTFVVDVGVFYLMAWIVLPSLREGDPFGMIIGVLGGQIRIVPEDILLRNFVINKIVAFLSSNTVAYITNVLFVFNDGRHQKFKEVVMFYVLSTTSFVFFTLLSRFLIARYDWQVTWAYFFVFTCAMMTNFTMRKKFVFKG
ncbi:GtrA family protein [Pontiella agarivorans]|uniref:GtrA family protein n=1 Tax=Pontiella agarivorans TaxID=3038953 RepID=A0ABU5N0P9_9BACT|nr:GtrA family protein [Pontiella agarivorans]MDZ8119816.1 GtrA family protein [Pontiella agarivorans]